MSSDPSRGLAALDRLPVSLPAGRRTDLLWVSDGPATAELWAALRQAHRDTGLWPLLLDSLPGDPRRPWDDDELFPLDSGNPADYAPEDLLAEWWESYAGPDEPGRWPGLADPIPVEQDPGEHADRCAAQLLSRSPTLRLGLVPADRPSDAITVIGWSGAVNHTNDPAELSAVLRSWKNRFGAYLIGVGFADLHLSVAAPPTDPDDTYDVAREHLAFCPDNISPGPGKLEAYADSLAAAPVWSFWWD